MSLQFAWEVGEFLFSCFACSPDFDAVPANEKICVGLWGLDFSELVLCIGVRSSHSGRLRIWYEDSRIAAIPWHGGGTRKLIQSSFGNLWVDDSEGIVHRPR